MIELVVLDMAGTTVDDRGAVYDALRLAVEAEGVTVAAADLQRWMGTDKREAITALASIGGVRLDRTGVEDAYERFRSTLRASYEADPPVPIAGVEAALRELRDDDVKVALTTGFAHDVADPLLVSLGWEVGGELVDAVVCADEVAAGRPAPYMVFRAMEKAGVLPVGRVLVAGDTLVDLEAGTNAGAAAVVGVGTGKLGLEQLAHAPHTHLLASLATLPELVASLA